MPSVDCYSIMQLYGLLVVQYCHQLSIHISQRFHAHANLWKSRVAHRTGCKSSHNLEDKKIQTPHYTMLCRYSFPRASSHAVLCQVYQSSRIYARPCQKLEKTDPPISQDDLYQWSVIAQRAEDHSFLLPGSWLLSTAAMPQSLGLNTIGQMPQCLVSRIFSVICIEVVMLCGFDT